MASSILIVEDDPFIAHDMAQQLSGAGFDVVGPASRADEGLELLARAGCQAAVLDVNLGRETSEVVARELCNRHIPFITVSGYSTEQHPPIFRGTPLLTKPIQFAALIAELNRLLTSR